MPRTPPLCLEVIFTNVSATANPNIYTSTLTTPGQGYDGGNSYYTGNDVAIGMWAANNSFGYAFKIISVSNASTGSVDVSLEDVNGFNTLVDPSGNGGGPSNNTLGYVFELNASGLPVLTAATSAPNFVWTDSELGRFIYQQTGTSGGGISAAGTNYSDYLYWNGSSWDVGSTAVHIGANAGNSSQGIECVAIGNLAGETSQGRNAVAIGTNAGNSQQKLNSIAIGNYAGNNNQGTGSISIGFVAGETSQGDSSVAIGPFSGQQSQKDQAVAIGESAGITNQGTRSVAIGSQAGAIAQGANSIAIGYNAGFNNQPANSVVINASGSDPYGGYPGNGTFISPINSGLNSNLVSNGFTGPLMYNPSTFELKYATDGTIGSIGPTGSTGPGVPTGGASGYVLTKFSPANYDTVWSAPSGGTTKSGFYQVNFGATSAFGTTVDISNFPSTIGTWSTPTSTAIVLTFNNTLYTSSSIPPFFSGYVGFWNTATNSYKLLNIAGPITSSNPTVTLLHNGSSWVYTMTINGTTFGSSTNNGTYGFFLVMNMAN